MAGDDHHDYKYSDEDAARWVQTLRFGSDTDKVYARWLLAEFFERRGQITEAIELHESNMTLGIFLDYTVDALARLYRSQGRSVLASQLEWDYNVLTNPSDLAFLADQMEDWVSASIISDFGNAVLALAGYVIGIDESHLPFERMAIQAAFCKEISKKHESRYDEAVLENGYLLLAKFIPHPDGQSAMAVYISDGEDTPQHTAQAHMDLSANESSVDLKRIVSAVGTRERLFRSHIDTWLGEPYIAPR